jgi:hypothetical protein
MAPLSGSPAIDAGDDTLASTIVLDQRGYPRLSGAHVDIGAFEVQVANPNNPPLLGSPVLMTNGVSAFSFTNNPYVEFRVLASTNVTLPFEQWTELGTTTESVPGQYSFSDAGASNYPQRFYSVVSP